MSAIIPINSLPMPTSAHADASAAVRMIGDHPATARLREEVVRAARIDAPVVVEGQTGTGKELVAQLLHRSSGVRGPLVALNVAALPEQLVEGELFGVARGAYTGATASRPGLIEEAHRGTLFLDEASELPPLTQAKLLRLLETRQVRRLGSSAERQTQFRLVLSVQQPVSSLLLSGRWRADFFYRVVGIVLHVPPLGERRSDIPALVLHFLSRYGHGPVPREWIAPLETRPWPGNIRELQRVVERALFLARGGGLCPEHLAEAAAERQLPSGLTTSCSDAAAGRSLRAAEGAHIETTLRDLGYDVRAAAGRLGLSRSQLYRRMQRLGLEPPTRR